MMPDRRFPVRADGYALEYHDEGSSYSVAYCECSNCPKNPSEFGTWEEAIVEKEDRELDGDHGWVVQYFSGDL